MDIHNQHQDEEALDRLLQEYLLEDGDDAAVQQSLDILSGSVFREESVMEPGSAREETLKNITGKNGFRFGANGFTFSLSVILLLLLVGSIAVLIPSKEKLTPADAAPSSISIEKESALPVTPASIKPETENTKNESGFFERIFRETKTFFASHDMPDGAEMQLPVPDKAADFHLLRARLAALNESNANDALYLRTDKTFYRTGEHIWLAVHVRDAATLRPSQMSEVVYVHLMNPKNQVEKSIRLVAQNGIAAGDFLLDEHLPGGIYTLKTYTNWQKNDAGARFHETPIRVQQVVSSDLSLRLEFDKEQFSAKEKIKATVKFQTANGEPLKNFSFQCVVTLAGERRLEFDKTTNDIGKASLEFKLPDDADITKGFLNFYFEYKGNTEYLSKEIPLHVDEFRVEFYPESGQLVQGIESRVAFQAADAQGNPLAVNGKLRDNEGRDVLAFSESKKGKGFFYFTPEAGKTYSAIVTGNSGTSVFALPAATAQGFVLQVDSITRENIALSIKSSRAATILLAAMQRGKVCSMHQHTLRKGVNSITLPIAELPMGVLHITLFDEAHIPQAERLAFIHPQKKLHITLQTNATTFGIHEQVLLDARVSDETGEAQPAHLTLSVANAQLLAGAPAHNLFSALYVQPDAEENLSGSITSLLTQQEWNAQELDLAMLTEGWRNFSWEMQEQQPERYHNERAVVAGKIIDPVSGRPMAGVEIAVAGAGKVVTGANGRFSFERLNLEERMELTLTLGKETMSYFIDEYADDMEIIFYGDGKKIYQPEEKGIRHPLVKALRSPGDTGALVLGKAVGNDYEPLPLATVQLMKDDKVIATTITDKNGFYQIETSVPGIYSVLVSHRNYTAHHYSGYALEAGKTLLLDILLTDEKQQDASPPPSFALATAGASYPVKLPALKTTELNLGSGVDFSKVLNGFSDVYKLDDMGNLHVKAFEEKNNIYVDGLKLEYNRPVSIATSSIDDIRVYHAESAAFSGEESDYIVEIKTSAAGAPDAPRKEAYLAHYYRAREFPRIRYNPGKSEPAGNDFRTTLFWNPRLQTNASGASAAEFFTSDVPGTYKVIVEGISADGKAGYAELVIVVKE